MPGMPATIQWTDEMDKTMRALRADRVAWDKVAARLGVDAKAAVRRAKKIGIATGNQRRREPARQP